MHEVLGSSGMPMQVVEGALKSVGLLPPSMTAVILAGAFPELLTVTTGCVEPAATLKAMGRPKTGAVKGEPLTSLKYPVERSTE
jgi:hypothetical protein